MYRPVSVMLLRSMVTETLHGVLGAIGGQNLLELDNKLSDRSRLNARVTVRIESYSMIGVPLCDVV